MTETTTILEKAGIEVNGTDAATLAPLTAASEMALMQQMSLYPDTLAVAADDLAPHHVVYYLKDLAAAVHSFCGGNERVLTDDLALKTARVHLLSAARIVLQNGLKLLGVSAPNRM